MAAAQSGFGAELIDRTEDSCADESMSSYLGGGKRQSAIRRTGSEWTISKLDAFATFLRGFTTSQLHTPSRKACIEAFVGANYRELLSDGQSPGSTALMMPDLGADEPQAFLDGIAKMALETNPSFHAYVFMEHREPRCEAIKKLQTDFPRIVLKGAVRSGGATAEIEKMCALDWSERRAVMFLDPFGMQVEWKTIEAIARTQAIDLWILYPLGLGTTQLANKPSEVPASWRQHLNRLLGTEAWYADFIAAEATPTLFRDEQATVDARADVMGGYLRRRLLGVFSTVAEHPRVLRGSAQQPLYLCCFAAGNSAGTGNVLRFANKLLDRLSG